MRFAGATIAAKSALALARVVARSFAATHPGAPFFVLLADEVDGYLDPDEEPFELLTLQELELSHPERFRFALPQQPLSYALTPYLIAKLLDLGFEGVVFVKQESLVLGDLSSIVSSLPEGGVALTPHLLSPLQSDDAEERELNILLSGVFNAGFVGAAAGEPSRQFLSWWQDRVYRHCRLAVADGIHYEQRWLDLAPAYFENVRVVRDPGVNVAHWNLPERRVAVNADGVTVDGRPCRLFRFSGYDPNRPDAATRYSSRLRTSALGDAGTVFERYRTTLLEAGWVETSSWPYAYGRFDDGTPIPDFVRNLYAGLDDVTRFGNPFATGEDRAFLRWLKEPVEQEAGPTRLWFAAYNERPDLQLAFPDVFGRDGAAFQRWVASSGAHEYGIAQALR